ncbi:MULTISPECIES: hypothetical protein [unclassified Nocardia]|uniref:hypothetical protein n=1 Tax=unclassified Nocardia TaxID=2637762 RepID=UPI001CE3C1E7|nr:MULTISPECIES: hypothetical protein [unclassified Nocardia]
MAGTTGMDGRVELLGGTERGAGGLGAAVDGAAGVVGFVGVAGVVGVAGADGEVGGVVGVVGGCAIAELVTKNDASTAVTAAAV